MARTTAIRAEEFRAHWAPSSGGGGGRRYAARKARTAAYRTSDGMERELLRPVID
jgi:hypothetical protein